MYRKVVHTRVEVYFDWPCRSHPVEQAFTPAEALLVELRISMQACAVKHVNTWPVHKQSANHMRDDCRCNCKIQLVGSASTGVVDID